MTVQFILRMLIVFVIVIVPVAIGVASSVSRRPTTCGIPSSSVRERRSTRGARARPAGWC